MVANQILKNEEDLMDIQFWLARSNSERIAEVTRLRRLYYSWLLGNYPERMEKTITHRNNDI
ncbi:hypothetical protein C4F49_04995 [Sphingobacterium sp. KB22]|uniref:Uncharacterized protein n=2 Tax=Sphingobacterium hungaricum TaxID=2082723 RepID=A0A928UYQ5_9SPHI|nr:hypothetical protein [Sphingobacterium hungaricum]